MLKYPWEQELDEAEARERAVEKNWKSAEQTRVEEIGRYGLEYWIYFQAIRALIGIFLLVSLLAAPKITFVLQGSAIQQTDIFAWIARASLGNVQLSTKLHLGLLDLTLQDSPVLGILDVLQLAGPLAFILWFRFFRIPWLIQNPELRTLSVADYAVQVDGLPPRLPDETANQKYDFELLRHFEAVLHSLEGADATSMVCEAALERDWSGALSAAEERRKAQAELASLQESAKPSPSRQARLRERVDLLTKELASKRGEEGDRPVRRAYVVLGSEEDRARLLRAYRLAALPLLGPRLQPQRLRLDGRWPLRLSPAPEPGDLVWAHCHTSAAKAVFLGAPAVAVLLLTLTGCGGLSFLAWWALLGTRGAAATQCSPTAGLSDASALCLTPRGAGDGAWETGCDCVCLPPTHWRSEASECRSLGAVRATSAVVLCWLLGESAQLLLGRFLPRLADHWSTVLASNVERIKLVLLGLARILVPLLASWGLLMWKAFIDQNRPAGLAAPFIWEVDRGWYLHAAPVAVLWCLSRWMGPVLFAFATCCCGAGRAGYRLFLWERWASLICAVAVTILLQPLLPYLAPLATIGLIARYWAEKFVFLRGHVVVRSGTPNAIAVRLVRTAFVLLWLAVAAAAGLAAWTQGEAPGLGRRLKGPALPCFFMLVVVLGVPVVAKFVPRCPRARKRGGGSTAALNFQEAWLIMRHGEILASYQIHEHPAYKGGTVLKELQPDVSSMDRSRPPVASSHWSRNLDMLPSLALVGDKAPTRGGK